MIAPAVHLVVLRYDKKPRLRGFLLFSGHARELLKPITTLSHRSYIYRHTTSPSTSTALPYTAWKSHRYNYNIGPLDYSSHRPVWLPILYTDRAKARSTLRVMSRHIIHWTPPTVTINYQALPPLVKIQNQKLLRRSQLQRVYPVKEVSIPLQGDQKVLKGEFRNLEWLGDAVLSHFSTEILLERWPDLSTGSLTRVKAALIRNLTLSHVSFHLGIYGHPKHMEEPASQSLAADSFEAYIGALYKDAQRRGKPYLVRHWLEKLWSPAVFPNLKKIATSQPPTIAKGEKARGKGNQLKGKEEPPVQLSKAKPNSLVGLLEAKINSLGLEAGKEAEKKATADVEVGKAATKATPVSSKASSPKPKPKPEVTIRASTKLQGDQPKIKKKAEVIKAKASPATSTPTPKLRKHKKQPILV